MAQQSDPVSALVLTASSTDRADGPVLSERSFQRESKGPVLSERSCQRESKGPVLSERSCQRESKDAVAIFSAPGVGVVMQWWAESNRRWAEQNRLKPMLAYPEQKAVK